MKRCSMSLTIRELQIKTTMRYHLTPVRIDITKKSTNNKFWRGGREQRTLLHYWWECKLIQPLWNFSFQFIHQNFWLLTESDILRYATLKIHLVWRATVVFRLYKNPGLKPVTRADKDLVCIDNFLFVLKNVCLTNSSLFTFIGSYNWHVMQTFLMLKDQFSSLQQHTSGFCFKNYFPLPWRWDPQSSCCFWSNPSCL